MALLFLNACMPRLQKEIQSLQTAPAAEEPTKGVTVYTTAENTNLRLTQTNELKWQTFKQPLESQVAVFVNPNRSYQTFMGIGGAITDASAETFYKLPPSLQQEVLEAYYSPEKGIGYTLARTTIHSSDFSRASYTYVQEGDSELKTFDIAHDTAYRIPLIKKIISETGKNLILYASPWSPPAFMKDNNTMIRGGKLKPAFAQSWANYYVKFIKAYEKEGIPIWGLSVQNEPMATQRWESLIYTAEEERDFLKNHLGPTLAQNGLADKKIIVWDHNRDLIYHRAHTILSDPEAAKYVWGIGFHWYETWAGGKPMFENVTRVNEAFPDKNLIFTEGTIENFNPDRFNAWSHGERYGQSMIHDFNSGVVAWTDWNILLDETGGPNHAKNFCFAPIHGDVQAAKLIYTNSYYYIGHFSKFIRPQAKRIHSVASRSQLLTTAFRNENGKIAVIVMNESDLKITYFLVLGTKAVEVNILPHAIQTLLLH